MENIYLKDALEYCKEEELYLGEGTQTAQILFIGKEAGWNDKMENPNSKEEIENQSKISTKHNLECWQNENGALDRLKEDALKCWPNSPTWKNYQKIVEGIIGEKVAKYDFLDYSFITELSQVPLPNSNYLKDKTLTRQSIQRRKELFKKEFFQNFPIVIMSCGHYPNFFDFDIENTFSVKWTGKTDALSKGNFINVHYGKNKILIHTRQVSLGVTNKLLEEIARLCKDFYK